MGKLCYLLELRYSGNICENDEEKLKRRLTWRTEKPPGQEIIPKEERAINDQPDSILQVYFQKGKLILNIVSYQIVTDPTPWISIWVLMERERTLELNLKGNFTEYFKIMEQLVLFWHASNTF